MGGCRSQSLQENPVSSQAWQLRTCLQASLPIERYKEDISGGKFSSLFKSLPFDNHSRKPWTLPMGLWNNRLPQTVLTCPHSPCLAFEAPDERCQPSGSFTWNITAMQSCRSILEKVRMDRCRAKISPSWVLGGFTSLGLFNQMASSCLRDIMQAVFSAGPLNC